MSQQTDNPQTDLKRVAFVAMPFGTRPIGETSKPGPTQVDFDALWKKAFFPALTRLGYLPIRADNQIGTVIVKEMLEQLVHVDLVLADISIINGNVYYEAGVRHAAQKNGCVLLRADWAKPLFDLAQIRQLSYPFPVAEPKEADYQAIEQLLVEKLQEFASSVSPVYELVKGLADQQTGSQWLKEVSAPLFQYQTRLTAATIKAASNDKSDLRALLSKNVLAQLPVYALMDLACAVRDHLSWSDLLQMLDSLPQDIADQSYFLELKSQALTRIGRQFDGIGLLEAVIEKGGASATRYATLGGYYWELAIEEKQKTNQQKHMAKAVEAYRNGMLLDLNQHHCPQKLLVALLWRRSEDDQQEMLRCAVLARAAVERTKALNPKDEWIHWTLLVLDFVEQNEASAKKRVRAILNAGWSNWKLVGLVRDLRAVLVGLRLPDEQKPVYEALIELLNERLPITQAILMQRIMPLLKSKAGHYFKFQQVHARPAVPGERIVSFTSDGEETSVIAKEGDRVVMNLTQAKEHYLVNQKKFDDRYTLVKALDQDQGWSLFDPKGEVFALEIDSEIVNLLKVEGVFFIVAPWKEEQIARQGDMLVCPCPAQDEIYRIARKEFEETYRIRS